MAQQDKSFNELPELGDMPVIKRPDEITISRKRRVLMFLSKYTAAALLGVLAAISLPALSEGVEEGLKPPQFIQTLVDEVTPVPEPTAKERMGVFVATTWADAQQRYHALVEGWLDPSARELKLKREIEALHKDVKFLTNKSAKQDQELRTKRLERGVKHEEMSSCAEEVFTYLRVMGGS